MKKQLFFIFAIGLLSLVALNIKNVQAACSALTDAQAQCYLDRYVDLQAAFGSTGATAIASAKQHWLTSGCDASGVEGRHASCPGTQTALTDAQAQCYLDRYVDLQNAFGTGTSTAAIAAAKQHWQEFGFSEGRTASCDDDPVLPACNTADSCFCVTKQKLMSVKYFNKTLYAGGYGYAAGQDHEAELYTCVEGESKVEKVFDAESVFGLEDFNSSLYMTHEQGDWNGKAGFATVYKLENNNWVRKFIDTNRSLGMEFTKILNALYFSAVDFANRVGGTVYQTIDGKDWNSTFTVSNGCSTEYLANYNNMLYAGSGCGSIPALWRGNGERVATPYDSENKMQFSGMAAFGNNLYLGMGGGGNNCRIVKYDGNSSYQEVYKCPTDHTGLTWMRATEKYVYALVQTDWGAQSGDSLLIKSSTGSSGSWSTVKTFDMPEAVWADITSDGTIYVAGGQHGEYGKIYKVAGDGSTSTPSPTPTPTPTSSPLVITPDSLPAGVINQAYSAYINVSGGGDNAYYVWTVSGLPSGLRKEDLSMLSGAVSMIQIIGTPTVASTSAVTITVTSGTQSLSKQFTLVITGPSAGPAGYTWCANENGSCALSGTCDVAFGANDKFNYKYNQTGTITFSNAVFGDPIPNVVKAGYYKCAGNATSSPSPTPSPSPSVSPSSSPTPSPSPTSSLIPSPTPTPSPSPLYTGTVSNGMLIKTATSPQVYVITNDQKKWIQNEKEFNQAGYKWSDIKTVARQTIDSIPDYAALYTGKISNGMLIKSVNDPKVYVITNNQKKWIQNEQEFSRAGYKWSDVKVVSPTTLASFSDAAETITNGSLIKTADSPKVYVIINNQKKWIQSEQEFKQAGYKWANVKVVSSVTLASFSDYEVKLLKGPDNKVYKVINNKKIWIPSIEAFNKQRLDWNQVQSVSAAQISQYQRIKLIRAWEDEKVYYITESSLKRHIPTVAVFDSYNDKWEDVVMVDPKDVLSYPDNTLIKLEDENDPKVYKLENGKKRWIQTAQTFNRLKYDWNKIAPVNQTELNAYPEGQTIK